MLTFVRSQKRTIKARAAYATHLPLFIAAVASCSGFSITYLTGPNSSDIKEPCFARALTKSSRPPTANDSVRDSAFGILEKVEVKQASTPSWLFWTEWQISVYDLPDDVGK